MAALAPDHRRGAFPGITGWELQGKAVVVTGAGRGLGAAYARAVAAAGGGVVVNDIDSAPAESVVAQIRAAGGAAVAAVADVSDWGQAHELMDRCIASFGRLDGLINNAGIMRLGAIDKLSERDWRASMEVNVLGTAFCGAHAARHMVRQGSGAILNVTSGSHAGDREESAYGASKGAVASLTYAWAADLLGQGVRVNAISPLADTALTQQAREYSRLSEQAPRLEQVPAADAMAPLAVYLLSDAAAAIAGQIVRFDGQRLSLLVHPAVLHPAVEHSSWSFRDFKRIFDDDLAARSWPLGLAEAEARVVPAR